MSGRAYPEGASVIDDTARNHDVPDADIVHAYEHRIREQQANRGMWMLTGFARSLELLEIGYVFETAT